MMQKLKNNDDNNFKKMSIQINLDGLSFCVFNNSASLITSIHTLQLPTELNLQQKEDKIKAFIKNEYNLKQDFDNIKIIHNSDAFCFVPQEFFSEFNLKDYLSPLAQNLQNLNFDHTTPNFYTVYQKFEDVKNILQQEYGAFENEHFTTPLLKLVLPHQQTQQNTCYLLFNKKQLHIVVVKNQDLILLNKFFINSTTDLIYYISFVFEQLGLSMAKTPTFLFGDIIRNSENFKHISNYIKLLFFASFPNEKSFFEGMDMQLARQNFVLTHAF